MNPRVKIIFILIFAIQSCKKTENFEGRTLIGYIPMKTILDKEKPNYKWYYKTELTFKRDSVFIKKSPVSIFKLDTLYSTSDGGFYKYAGTWKNGDTFEINAVEVSCDYCPEELIKDSKGNIKKVLRKENFKGLKVEEGLKLNGIVFK